MKKQIVSIMEEYGQLINPREDISTSEAKEIIRFSLTKMEIVGNSYQMQSCACYLADSEYDSGGNVVYQVTELREWAAACMPAALSHIIERRCM